MKKNVVDVVNTSIEDLFIGFQNGIGRDFETLQHKLDFLNQNNSQIFSYLPIFPRKIVRLISPQVQKYGVKSQQKYIFNNK